MIFKTERRGFMNFCVWCRMIPCNTWNCIISFKNRKNKLALLSDSTSDRSNDSEIWFEVALSELLQLTDVPFLEDILTPPLTHDGLGVIVISNNIPRSCAENLQLKQNADKEINSSELCNVWLTPGMECIHLQKEHPLPQRGDTGFLNTINIKEMGIQQILAEYYGSLLDSLIPTNFADLVDGMICALANDCSKVVTFLPLLAVMLPASQQEHLKKLLSFIGRSVDTKSGRFIVKKFMGAILPKTIQNKVHSLFFYSVEVVCEKSQNAAEYRLHV